MYSEEHGSGEALVLLHGGMAGSEMLAPLIPALAAEKQVITYDLPGHGRSALQPGPLRPAAVADQLAAELPGPVDLLGYSLGGEVAFRLAVQHPRLVRRLILVSIPFRRDAYFPEVIAAFDAMSPDTAAMLRQSPVYAHYERVAPDPQAWDEHVAQTVELLAEDFDWSDEVQRLPERTMLVYADNDIVRPAHIAEFYAALGGGLADPGWDGTKQPPSRLAVLPGHSHYDLLDSPLLAPAILGFLQSST
jgi:pimeloyl-ACP methyl ester carboxylesterase